VLDYKPALSRFSNALKIIAISFIHSFNRNGMGPTAKPSAERQTRLGLIDDSEEKDLGVIISEDLK